MPREFIITPTRFQALVDENQTAVWDSLQHDLMYSVAGRPKGADRSSDFTVSSFVQMRFNKPLTPGWVLSVRGAPALTYAGIGGIERDPPPSINMLSVPGFFAFGQDVYFGPPLPQYGSSFQIINFPAGKVLGNLGQSVLFRAAFWPRRVAGPVRCEIDVTFTGALVSSDPI